MAFPSLRQPGRQSFREAFRRETKACLDPSISHRQRVVEIRGIREVAHAKLIQPFERAGLGFALNDDVDLESLRVHKDCRRSLGQGNPQKLDALAFRWVQNQSLS